MLMMLTSWLSGLIPGAIFGIIFAIFSIKFNPPQKKRNLKDKIVWITGASSGMGEALVKLCAEKGCKIVLSARREAELQRVAKAAGLGDENSLVLPMDVADTNTFTEAVQKVVDRFGGIDILINNAGISQRGSVLDTTEATVRRMMDVNFFAPVMLTKAALPSLLSRKGCVVVQSSVQGKVSLPDRSSYSASKHALIGYFESLRAELSCEGLGVVISTPGYVKTRLGENALLGDGRAAGGVQVEAPKGITSEKAAEGILKAICANAQEVFVGGAKENAALWIQRISPVVMRAIVKKKKVGAEKDGEQKKKE